MTERTERSGSKTIMNSHSIHMTTIWAPICTVHLPPSPLNPARRHALPHGCTTCAIRWRRHAAYKVLYLPAHLPAAYRIPSRCKLCLPGDLCVLTRSPVQGGIHSKYSLSNDISMTPQGCHPKRCSRKFAHTVKEYGNVLKLLNAFLFWRQKWNFSLVIVIYISQNYLFDHKYNCYVRQ